jgi:hypothetical protein
VRLIDGTDVFVPINAKIVGPNKFEILPDSEFDFEDPNLLFEFFPGDIVEGRQNSFSDGTNGFLASRLERPSDFPDRRFLEFKYLAAQEQIPIDKITADKYRVEIDRVQDDLRSGQIYYPPVVETCQKLKKLTE